MSETFDWYSCPVFGGSIDYSGCSFMYTETKCYAWADDGSSGSGGTGTSGGGHTGNYSSFWEVGASPTQLATGKIKPCNRDFQRVGTTTWQAATLKNIGIVLAPDGPLLFTLDVGLPYYSEQQDRLIPKGEAMNLSSQAAWEAMLQVGKEWQAGEIRRYLIPSRIAKLMAQKLDQKLGFVGPVVRVSLVAGTNGGKTSTYYDAFNTCIE